MATSPGTDKTTTARKMGKIYYDMGFLASGEVVEISTTDLVGEYIGHTGLKTQKLLQKALGKVLYIDEAFLLAEGRFCKEALDEIVDCLTKPSFSQKLVVILAAYDADFNQLVSINPDLTSRFPETANFRSLKPQECLNLFTKLLKRQKHLHTNVLEFPSTALQTKLLSRFETVLDHANWANARDVETLAKAIFGSLIRNTSPKSPRPIILDETSLPTALDNMITERSYRVRNITSSFHNRSYSLEPSVFGPQEPQPPSTIVTQTSHKSCPTEEFPSQRPHSEERGPQPHPVEARDSGVSDEIWDQLQLDNPAAIARDSNYVDLIALQSQLEADKFHIQAQEKYDYGEEEEKK